MTTKMAVALVFLAGCTNEAAPVPYDYEREFTLAAYQVGIDGIPASLDPSGCTDVDARMRICARQGNKVFNIGVQNLTGVEPMAVHWRGSGYIDEHGTRHRLVPYLDDDPFEVEPLAGPQRRWQDVVPEGKRSRRAYRGYSSIHVEPPIPWTPPESDDALRRQIEELFNRQSVVTLIIPVVTSREASREIRFDMRLERKVEDVD